MGSRDWPPLTAALICSFFPQTARTGEVVFKRMDPHSTVRAGDGSRRRWSHGPPTTSAQNTAAELPQLRVSMLACTQMDGRGWMAGTGMRIGAGVSVSVLGEGCGVGA